MKIFDNGNLSKPVRDICIAIGIALIWGGAYLFDGDVSNPTLWICVSLGTVVGGLGGACSLANRAGVKPFGTNWKKIRETYEKKDDDV
jgi:hypothetical protein